MNLNISYYCQKYKCGKCCERGWDIIVTERDIKRWKIKRPEIISQVTIKSIDGIEKKVIKKKLVKFPDGKIRELCVFYDFRKKCTIHADNPEICKRFSCLHHPYFIFQLFSKISELTEKSDSQNNL